MRKRLLLAAAAATLGSILTVGARAADADQGLIDRGHYLVTAGDCVACHTVPGGKPFAGGLAMGTPFGTIYTSNITPDKATGIGDWSDDDFYKSMHEGIGHKGEYLYPVFPFPWYTKVTRDDVVAMKAYLFSLPPVDAPQKPLKFMFPFNIRASLITWRTAFFKAETFKPDPDKSDQVNRGAYLVEGLGHCGECHNHNNLLGASNWSGKLKGGQIEGWYAPNITSDGKQGVGSWSEDEIVAFLHDGTAPGRGIVLGPMKQTIDDSLHYLTDPDLHAIAAYLKSFSSQQTYKSLDAQQVSNASGGSSAYLTNCASCHGAEGKGVKGMIPSLANNGSIKAAGPQNIIRVVLGGLPASNGYAPMPAAGSELSDEEVAGIVNYVRTGFGNDAPANANAGMVADLRTKTATIMSSNTAKGCTTPQAETAIAKGIDQDAVRQQLAGVKLPDMLQRIDDVLPKVKATVPDASDDAIVNAMITAYCPIALKDENTPPDQRTQLIGSFGGLVYGQIKKVESGEPIKN